MLNHGNRTMPLLAGRYPVPTATFAQSECSGAQRARFARSRVHSLSERHFFRRLQNSPDLSTLALAWRLVQRQAQGLTTQSRRGAPAKNIGFGAEPGAPGEEMRMVHVQRSRRQNLQKTQRRAPTFTCRAAARGQPGAPLAARRTRLRRAARAWSSAARAASARHLRCDGEEEIAKREDPSQV